MIEDTVLPWISHYGALVLFPLLMLGIFGLPVPDETLLMLTGYLSYRGDVNLPGSFVSALLGSLCGITLSFVIGRTGGKRLLRRYAPFLHMNEERIDRIHGWFEHLGRWALFFGYFLPGIRHVTAFVAGTYRLEYPAFALSAYTGGLVWVGTFLSIGYFAGRGWEQWGHRVHVYILIGTGVLLGLGAVAYVLRKKSIR